MRFLEPRAVFARMELSKPPDATVGGLSGLLRRGPRQLQKLWGANPSWAWARSKSVMFARSSGPPMME